MNHRSTSLHRAKAVYVENYTQMTPEMLQLRPVILEKKKV